MRAHADDRRATTRRTSLDGPSRSATAPQVGGVWDPDEEYWGEPDEPIPEYARPIIDRGPRPLYEMEQVLPGDDPDDPDGDPIIQSNDSKDRGDFAGAQMRYRAWADCNRTKPWRCWKKRT